MDPFAAQPNVDSPDAKAEAGAGTTAYPRRWRRRALAPRELTRLLVERRGTAGAQRRARDGRYRRLLVLADALATLTALVVALSLLGRGDSAAGAVVLGIPLVVLISKLTGLYDRDELVVRRSTLDEVPKLFQLATTFTLAAWILERPLRLGDLGGDQALGLWLTLFLTLGFARAVARWVARHTTPPERCLLLGDPAACNRLRETIEQCRGTHAEIVAQVGSERLNEDEVPLDFIARLAAEHWIHRVVIAPHSTDDHDVLSLVRAVKSLDLHVSVLPRVLEIVGSAVVVDDIDGQRILGVRRLGLTRSSAIIKRATDVLAATIGLVVAAPPMAVIAMVIKLDSRGPVLFRQQRIGRDGRPFQMLKFRSMVPGAESMQGELLHLNELPGLFKIADDPRMTRVGRLLRQTSLDELPQLVNVLRGDMSLVGPRPLVRDDDLRITGWARQRLHLTPGITGPWQVTGTERMPLEEMVKLDYLYVANWSLWGDVTVILKTLHYVFRRQGH